MNSFFTPTFASLPAAAISYPLRIVGDTRSAAVEFVDSTAFFGYEIRALSSVTFDGNRKIIRWVDYWDGRSSLNPKPSPIATPPTSRTPSRTPTPRPSGPPERSRPRSRPATPPRPSR